MMKRVISILMTLCLLMSMAAAPVSAMAEGSVAYEDILTMREMIAALQEQLADMEKQYALENANRKITFDKEEYFVIVKKSVTAETTVERLLEEAPEKTKLDWSTSDKSIAKVDSKGKITGVAAGTCVITATAKDDENVVASVNVTVIVPVKKIELSEKSVTLGIREVPVDPSEIPADVDPATYPTTKIEAGSFTILAEVSPAEAYDKSLTWKSNDEEVATVVDGVITAVGKGKATITAYANDGSEVKATVKVEVVQGVEEIKIDPVATRVSVGKKVTLKATVLPEKAGNKDVVWSSSDESIATVNSKGSVTGVSAGTCTIYATATDGTEEVGASIVQVIQPVTSITPKSTSISLKEGNTHQLAYTAAPANATDKSVTYKTSDKSVATVDSNGLVKAVGGGTCTITITAKDGSEVTGKVKVAVDPKYPLKITDVRVGHNSIDTPEVFLTVKNTSATESIIAFTFATKCYDAYGYLLKAHGFGDTTEYWIWQEGTIKPGKTWSSDWWRWTLYGFDTAYTIEVWLTDVRTADGRTISIPKTDATTFKWTKH